MRVQASQNFGWLVERTGCVLSADFKAIEAVDSSGRIRGMVGYQDWTANGVRMHFAFDAPIAMRSLLVPGFEYPFTQGNRGVAIGIIADNNHKSLKAAQHIGFEGVARIRDGHSDGVDLVILELRREKCRWLKQQRKAA